MLTILVTGVHVWDKSPRKYANRHAQTRMNNPFPPLRTTAVEPGRTSHLGCSLVAPQVARVFAPATCYVHRKTARSRAPAVPAPTERA